MPACPKTPESRWGRVADNTTVNVSVLIPTRGRPARLAACLRGLAGQDWLPGDEVVIGLDGDDPATEAVVRDASLPCDVRLRQFPKIGYIAVRHELTPSLRGDVLISMNDDVLPEPGFIEAHRASAELFGDEAAFVGYSPFAPVPSPSVIDRLAAVTPWVFFYDRMLAEPEADRDWGFRHLFGLNFSARLDRVRDCGGWTAMPDVYGYDDIELGHRLAASGLAIRFLPEAVATHNHRMSADDLLRREEALGHAAAWYASRRLDFTREVFGRDILADEVIAECQSNVPDAAELESFRALAGVPGDHADPFAVLERYRPLKRAVWARGLLRGVASLRDADQRRAA